MYLRSIIFVCCLVMHFGSGQLNVLTNSVNNNGHNDVVKKCAAFNEYCQTNTDCCSRNCLSFSYKCIRERIQQPELPSQGNQQPEQPFVSPPAGSVNSVQELVDRFGSDGDSSSSTPVDGPWPSNPHVPRPPFPPSSPSVPVLVNGDGFRPIAATTSGIPHHHQLPGDRPCYITGGNCLNSSQCCSGQCSRITNKCIVGDEQSQFLSQHSYTQDASTCSRHIGDKCLRHEDCCEPLHCHDYLHHCVS